MKHIEKNPLERKQRGALVTLCVVCILFAAGVFSSCSNTGDSEMFYF